jgi:hypothetical protein
VAYITGDSGEHSRRAVGIHFVGAGITPRTGEITLDFHAVLGTVAQEGIGDREQLGLRADAERALALLGEAT